MMPLLGADVSDSCVNGFPEKNIRLLCSPSDLSLSIRTATGGQEERCAQVRLDPEFLAVNSVGDESLLPSLATRTLPSFRFSRETRHPFFCAHLYVSPRKSGGCDPGLE